MRDFFYKFVVNYTKDVKALVFDSLSWSKVGDVGDNSCFWKEATVEKIYYREGEPLFDVRFTEDQRLSVAHIKGAVKYILNNVIEIYGIDGGCRNEGGGIGYNLFYNYDEAKAYLLYRIDKKQKEAEEYNIFLKTQAETYPNLFDENDLKKWVEERPDYWSDGYEYISICKLTIR